jgi:hypothetical protein
MLWHYSVTAVFYKSFEVRNVGNLGGGRGEIRKKPTRKYAYFCSIRGLGAGPPDKRSAALFTHFSNI